MRNYSVSWDQTPCLSQRRCRQNHIAIEACSSGGKVTQIERHDNPVNGVFQTMSWSGSDSLGLQGNARRTGLATTAKSSRTRPTSALLKPLAANCRGRVRTASYSKISGTDGNNSNWRCKAANESWREAPPSLRSAATITSVSRT